MSRKGEKERALPDGWQEVRLGDIMEFKNGLNTEKGNYGKGVKFVNVMDVFKFNYLYEHNVVGSVQVSEKNRIEYSVKYGDILFNRTSEILNEIAMSSVYLDEKKIIFGGFVIRGRQKITALTPRFSICCLQSNKVRKELIRRGQGAVRANIGQKDLAKIPVVIPPLPEQKAITSLLETWDTAIEKTEALIEAKEKRFKWLLKTLISNQQDNPEWREVRLGDVTKVIVGQSPKGIFYNTEGEGMPFYQGKSEFGKIYINNPNMWTTQTTKTAEKGDILMSIRAPVGSINRTNNKICIGRGLASIRVHSIKRTFLFFYLQFIKSQIIGNGGSIFNSITKRQVEQIPILCPPVSEQKAIAAVLNTVQREIDLLEQLTQQYRTQKRVLMQRLLTGEWRTKMNRYILRMGTYECPKTVIKKERFEQLKEARNILSKALVFEGNYEIIVHNYLELEKELMGITIEDIGRTYYSYDDFFNYTLSSNIRVSNLLNSAKFYIDTLSQTLENCFQNEEVSPDIKQIIKEDEGNSLLEFVYELRNYLQHVDLPVHNTLINRRWTDDNLMEYSTHIFSSKKYLSEDEKSESILKKMEEQKIMKEEEINLNLTIRHYVEFISKMHIQTRSKIEKRVNEARDCIESTIKEYLDEHRIKEKEYLDEDGKFIGFLHAFHFNHSEIEEKIPLFLDYDDVRLNLIRKNNKELVNLHKRYVTTRVDSVNKKEISK